MQPVTALPDNLATDAAVRTRAQDQFKRYPFAERIAQAIAGRSDSSSLVMSIYGEWGSGKSSVLNFIVAALADRPIIPMVFNPWLFSGEEQLLAGFFAQLTDVVASLDSVALEAAQRAVSNYSRQVVERVARFEAQGTPRQVESLTSQAALEGYKQELGELLRTAGKRILILIDDLDRLDKQEIQAMLRLVKLTGDFNYTTYLLAFDEEMVARAVGERYAGGGKAAGRRFLEKIIQVPLRLPVIQQEAMLKYFEKQLQLCLEATGVVLNPSEQNRLTGTLSASVLKSNVTPRDVSRYFNTEVV
jgi:predicted KAP-like P-loop ATPase